MAEDVRKERSGRGEERWLLGTYANALCGRGDVEGHCTTKRVPVDDKFVRGVNNRGCFCDLMIPAGTRFPSVHTLEMFACFHFSSRDAKLRSPRLFLHLRQLENF